jgi:hypothetical protein
MVMEIFLALDLLSTEIVGGRIIFTSWRSIKNTGAVDMDLRYYDLSCAIFQMSTCGLRVIPIRKQMLLRGGMVHMAFVGRPRISM